MIGSRPLEARPSGPVPTVRFTTLALMAIAGPLACWIVAAWIQPPNLYNDFHVYWYAGRLLSMGASPYDLAAMAQLAAREHDVFAHGTGFSYPIPFAYAMLPLAALPFDVAVTVFNLLSLAVFGTAVATWLRAFHPDAAGPRLRLAAFFAGAVPPGRRFTPRRPGQPPGRRRPGHRAAGDLQAGRARRRRGIAIGLAAIVKLVPGVVVVPLWLAGRRSAAAGIIAGAGVPLVLAAIARPDIVDRWRRTSGPVQPGSRISRTSPSTGS